MTFCIKCGSKLPKGSQFCPKCGASIVSGAKEEMKDYSGPGGTLILIGGVVSIVFSLLSVFGIAFMSMWRGMMSGWFWRSGMWGGWGIPIGITGWIIGFMVVGTVISIILGIIAVYAYKKVKSGDVKGGGTVAIIVSVVMLLTMNWLAGIITLIGGILCYNLK